MTHDGFPWDEQRYIYLHENHYKKYHFMYQVLPSDLFGGFKWPFQGLSDLHLGNQKVTWKKLVGFHFFPHNGCYEWWAPMRVREFGWTKIPQVALKRREIQRCLGSRGVHGSGRKITVSFGKFQAWEEHSMFTGYRSMNGWFLWGFPCIPVLWILWV